MAEPMHALRKADRIGPRTMSQYDFNRGSAGAEERRREYIGTNPIAPSAPRMKTSEPIRPLPHREASILQRNSPDRDLGGLFGGINRYGQSFGRNEVRSQNDMFGKRPERRTYKRLERRSTRSSGKR